MTESWMGVDVAKGHVDTFFDGKSRRFRLPEQSESFSSYVVQTCRPEGVVLEASGGYEKPVLALLIAHPHVSLVNPRHVRHFAKSSGQEA